MTFTDISMTDGITTSIVSEIPMPLVVMRFLVMQKGLKAWPLHYAHRGSGLAEHQDIMAQAA